MRYEETSKVSGHISGFLKSFQRVSEVLQGRFRGFKWWCATSGFWWHYRGVFEGFGVSQMCYKVSEKLSEGFKGVTGYSEGD